MPRKYQAGHCGTGHKINTRFNEAGADAPEIPCPTRYSWLVTKKLQ